MMKLDNNEFLISKVVGGCLGGIGLSKDLHATADTDSMQLKHLKTFESANSRQEQQQRVAQELGTQAGH